jgi:hypothetical protein
MEAEAKKAHQWVFPQYWGYPSPPLRLQKWQLSPMMALLAASRLEVIWGTSKDKNNASQV